MLGRVDIERDDMPVRFAGKAQLKPLDLLKVLSVAPQYKVDQRQVERWLWPDAADGAARAALEVAVHRLRKLLRCDEAVRVAAGKVQLSSEHVWVDAAAFEFWLDDAQLQLDAQPKRTAADLLAERLFADYRGPLFGDDSPTPWSIGPRERLHNKFLQLAGGLGRFHEVRLDWARAGTVYERGLAQDPLDEAFYRGLIRCQLARNEAAAAVHTFRRCRDILSVVLGVAPAPATRALIAKVPGAGT
jgi:DNA-binding SARP family transcriptional activator